LVRRIFAEFAAKEFVSVQPMNLPSGLVFYLDFKYGTAQPGFNDDNADPVSAAGHPFGAAESADSLFGITNTTGDPSGGLYGAGRFGYSINNALGTAATVSAGSSTGSGATHAAATSASVNFDSAYTSVSAQYFNLTVPVPTDADLYAVRAFTYEPGAWCNWKNEPFKVTSATALDVHELMPGVIAIEGQRVIVGCGNNTSVEFLTVIPAGKKEMNAADWARGARLSGGENFG
jgi:hypothetical protein